MKNVSCLLVLLLCTKVLHAQIIWNGPKITFSKANNADWTNAINQDRITDDVWISRKENQGIFNVAEENVYTTNVSPTGTKWSFGTTDNIGTLTFESWQEAVREDPPSMVNKNMVMWIVNEGIYIDVKFTFWQGNNIGGGFSYERSTEAPVSLNDVIQNELKIYPNPVQDKLYLSDKNYGKRIVIYDCTGQIRYLNEHYTASEINVSDFPAGMYAIRFEDGHMCKFLKNE